MKELTFKQLMEELNQLYPPQLAEDWDQVGLHFGDPDAPVNKIMTTLDVRHEIVDEAIAAGVDTLIVHHPLLFKPIKRFDLSSRQNRLYQKLVKHDIKVFAMHTNVDVATNGMNDWLAEELGLENIKPLEVTKDGEPGLGRIGNLPKPYSRQELLSLLKETYQRNELAVIELEPKATYQSIAIIGGSGTGFMDPVIDHQADVFLTGDITYHTAQTCEDLDFMTVDVGHYTEVIFVRKMAEVLRQLNNNHEWEVEVIETQLNINPFHYE